MIKAIVFDVDGTLVDNVGALAKGWKIFAKKMKLAPPTKKDVKDFLGIPYYDIAPQLWPGFNPYQNADMFRKCIESVASEMKPVITRKKVDNLKKKYKIAIVTSARRNNVKSYIGDLADSFNIIIAAEDTEKHKPDPMPLIKCCEKLRINPRDALYVGDTVFDYLCARGAGAQFVGVLTGVGTANYFKKLNVPYIKSVSDIEKYVENLNGQRNDRETEKSWKNSK